MGHVAHRGDKGNMYRVLAEKPEGRRAPSRRRRKWEDGIKMNFK